MSTPKRKGHRRPPSVAYLRSLLHLDLGGLDGANRIARQPDLEGIQHLARRRAPRAVYDYVDGAAEAETSAHRNLAAFRAADFRPPVLSNVASVDTSTTILGQSVAMPG